MSLDTEFRKIGGEVIFNSSLSNNYPIRDYFVNIFDSMESGNNCYRVSRKDICRFMASMSFYLLFGKESVSDLPDVFYEDKNLSDKEYQWKVIEAMECVARVLRENADEEFIFVADW